MARPRSASHHGSIVILCSYNCTWSRSGQKQKSFFSFRASEASQARSHQGADRWGDGCSSVAEAWRFLIDAPLRQARTALNNGCSERPALFTKKEHVWWCSRSTEGRAAVFSHSDGFFFLFNAQTLISSCGMWPWFRIRARLFPFVLLFPRALAVS